LKGELLENRIVVWNRLESRNLFANGYFGKPIGIPKPNVNDINVPLILALIEGCYLQETSKIKITKDGKKVSLDALIKICKKNIIILARNIKCTKILEIKDMLLILE